ncbi:unnamed protein product, partial [Anisakis simplex]
MLCRRRSPILKRRRLAGTVPSRNVSANHGGVSIQSIACTAFVHVTENISGCVSVRYCLEHCGHSVHHDTGAGESAGSSTIVTGGENGNRAAASRLRRHHIDGSTNTAAAGEPLSGSLGGGQTHLKRNSSSIRDDDSED